MILTLYKLGVLVHIKRYKQPLILSVQATRFSFTLIRMRHLAAPNLGHLHGFSLDELS